MAKEKLIKRFETDRRRKAAKQEYIVMMSIWTVCLLLSLFARNWGVALFSVNLMLAASRIKQEQELRILADELIDAQDNYIKGLEYSVKKLGGKIEKGKKDA